MLLNFTALSPVEAYHAMIHTVIPRPVAWVMTNNEDQSFNLAPFSFFTVIGPNPPILMFSAGKKTSGQTKDTIVNIQREKRFTLHIGAMAQVETLNQSSIELKYGQSEVEELGLKVMPLAEEWHRLEEAPIAFACRLYELLIMGEAPQQLVFGQVEHLYLRDDCVELDNKGRKVVRADYINPVARLGATEYTGIGEVIDLARPF